MDRKVAIVAGGAGFIGSYLCEALIEKGFDLICIDNLITGSRSNIDQLLSNHAFKFFEADVTKTLPIFKKVDYIFHLASPASVIDYQKYPEETALVNSVGTRNLLKIAQAHQAQFLYASTSEVYGDPLVHPQPETYWGNVNPNGDRSCYDEAKRFGEMITMLYGRKFDINVRIVRIFNTYGPRMKSDDGRVISNLVNQALTGKPLSVYGDGNQTRSFCFVSDLVRGVTVSMFTKNTKNQVINLGNPEEFRVIDLAKLILKKTKSKSGIKYSNLPPDDPSRRRPDISHARKLLDWTPTVDINAGLDKTIEYYENLINKI